MENKEPILVVKDLKQHFKINRNFTVKAVDGISFDIMPGETYGLVGESGSGKSTTGRSIIRLYKPTSGSIVFNGKEIGGKLNKETSKELHTKMQMIFQDPMTSLNPTMTIGNQIMEPMIHHYNTPKEEAYKKAVELLQLVGITNAEKRMKNYPHQLSGGMRQRVVIAIALACDPDILICDEPTTALDVTIQAKILELIKEIQVKKNISVIYITHDLGVVAKVADYVAVMYAGKIIEKGSVDEIFYDPRHPYTWGLLSSMPDIETHDEVLYTIPGTPPNLLNKVEGDAFASRNEYALNIDFRVEPPQFDIGGKHRVSSWLLHENAPKVEMPASLKHRIEKMLKGGR